MKQRLRELLDQGRIDEIADLAEGRRRVLIFLRALTFDRDPLIAWRAVEAMGVAADRVADQDPDLVLEQLRGLYWLVSEESGGICWHAPQAMAELVRQRPKRFSEYIPITVWLLTEMAEEDLAHFRPGILWAIGRLGSIAGDEIDGLMPSIEACLDHADPQVRGMAVWCLEQVGRPEVLHGHADLFADGGRVALYENGDLSLTTVSDLVLRAVGDAAGD